MGFFIRGAVILDYVLFIFWPDFRVTYSFNSIISSTIHEHEKLIDVSAEFYFFFFFANNNWPV